MAAPRCAIGDVPAFAKVFSRSVSLALNAHNEALPPDRISGGRASMDRSQAEPGNERITHFLGSVGYRAIAWRPGRPGGSQQVAARQALASEGFQNVENVELGGRYPDMVRYADGRIDYLEVGEMLQSGMPSARERTKLADRAAWRSH